MVLFSVLLNFHCNNNNVNFKECIMVHWSVTSLVIICHERATDSSGFRSRETALVMSYCLVCACMLAEREFIPSIEDLG